MIESAAAKALLDYTTDRCPIDLHIKPQRHHVGAIKTVAEIYSISASTRGVSTRTHSVSSEFRVAAYPPSRCASIRRRSRGFSFDRRDQFFASAIQKAW